MLDPQPYRKVRTTRHLASYKPEVSSFFHARSLRERPEPASDGSPDPTSVKITAVTGKREQMGTADVEFFQPSRKPMKLLPQPTRAYPKVLVAADPPAKSFSLVAGFSGKPPWFLKKAIAVKKRPQLRFWV